MAGSSAIDNSEWLQNVLHGLQWKKLTQLTLHHIGIDFKSVRNLLYDHRGTLQNLTVNECRQKAQEWYQLLGLLRKELSLRFASVKISSRDLKVAVSEELNKLNKIIKDFRVTKQYKDVDIGSYVVKPNNVSASNATTAAKSKTKTIPKDADAAK